MLIKPVLPSLGALRLISEIEFQSARLSWLERHAACLAEGTGIARFHELTFASEKLWSAARDKCRKSASIRKIAALILKPAFAADELEGVSDLAASPMREAVKEDLERLAAAARGAIEASGGTVTNAVVAEIVADICEVHAICAGLMRQTYCSHDSERHASALIAMLLHPAVNSGELLPQEVRASAKALVPYVAQGPAADDMTQVLTPSRVTALRSRVFRDTQLAPGASRRRAGRVSRYAKLSCKEAAAELLQDSPRKTKLDTPHVTAGLGWAAGTRKHFDGLVKLLDKFFKDRPMASLETSDWRKFFEVLEKLPKRHHKSKFDADRSLDEICETAARKVAEGELALEQIGIGNTAINRNISNIRTLYGWLTQHIDLPDIMWAQFCEPVPRPPRDRAYLPEQVRSLFDHPTFTGRTSPTGPALPGPHIWHNAAYWVPLILVYSGGRLGGACGLRVKDIKKLGGIPYIAFRDHKDRELKRMASVRDVPIHPELIRLGFLDFVEAMKCEGETLLFPELHSPGGRPMSGNYVEFVGKFLKRDFTFMKEGELTHGLRHYVNDQLRLEEVPLAVRQALIGHRGTENLKLRRNSIPNLERLRKAQALLPVPTAHLQPAPILLHPAERRRRQVRNYTR